MQCTKGEQANSKQAQPLQHLRISLFSLIYSWSSAASKYSKVSFILPGFASIRLSLAFALLSTGFSVQLPSKSNAYPSSHLHTRTHTLVSKRPVAPLLYRTRTCLIPESLTISDEPRAVIPFRRLFFSILFYFILFFANLSLLAAPPGSGPSCLLKSWRRDGKSSRARGTRSPRRKSNRESKSRG
ncbi:hypothetical protein AA313_de0200911 [Arthrobotrys entomopaga]|nr:hypothetical protein AA313_de0200911 [Arthrobotrys entomopaga]